MRARGTRVLLCLIVAALAAPPAARADEAIGETSTAAGPSKSDTINTNRPGATDSAETVAPWRPQFELGANFATITPVPGERDWFVATPAQFRLGIIENFELDLAFAGLAYDREVFRGQPTDHHGGAGDLIPGAKVHLIDGPSGGPSLLPSTGFETFVEIPTAEPRFRPPGPVPEARFLFTWSMPADLQLSWNPAVRVGFDVDRQRLTQWHTPVVVSRPFTPWTDRAGAYVSFDIFVPDFTRRGALVQFESGIAVLLSDDVQLDAEGFTDIAGQAPNVGAGIGLSFRLP
jgi:hypothetical protein